MTHNCGKSRLYEKIVLYGWKSAVMIAAKALLRKLTGIGWQKCYLMSCTLDGVCPPPKRSDVYLRECTLADYENELWKDFMTDKKRAVYEARFKGSHDRAYGAFIGGTLAYSTWIQYGKVTYHETQTLMESPDCALLLDSYCHPHFRGMGLHNYMNQWCLHKMKLNGAKKAYVIVLSYNRPAIKTQRKCGLEVEKVFYSYALGNRIFTKL